MSTGRGIEIERGFEVERGRSMFWPKLVRRSAKYRGTIKEVHGMAVVPSGHTSHAVPFGHTSHVKREVTRVVVGQKAGSGPRHIWQARPCSVAQGAVGIVHVACSPVI